MQFIPYGRQDISKDDIKCVIDTLKSPFITTGNKVLEFENALCSYCNAKYCVSVSSGTSALHLASLVLLEEDDEVLTTVNSFVATSNAILYAKAKPIFVDIDKEGNIDLDLCETMLQKNKKIKALYGISFSGNMLHQEKLRHLKNTYNIKILEDNAHSFGARYKDIISGSCANSDISIFSFHPLKHITTGEGGAVMTNDKSIYEKILSLRSHGIVKKEHMRAWEYEQRDLGFNYRLSDIQCALGISQLKKIDIFIQKRIKIAKRYDEVLKNTIIKPLYTYTSNSSYHLYVVRVDFCKLNITKEQLFIKMKEYNIGLQVHYIPINKQPYYKSLGYSNESTPVMDKYYKECFSLPIYPLLSSVQQEYVIETLFKILKQNEK